MIVLKLSLVSGRRTFFGRGNEIHYIGGTEILPAPLDTAEEQKMIHMLGTVNEETARSMLIERNLRLVVYIAKKFDNTGIGVEDLISIGTIGLINREKMIIELRFGINQKEGKEKTQKEVADMLGISQSYISRLEKKIIKRLKREMIKMGCV